MERRNEVTTWYYRRKRLFWVSIAMFLLSALFLWASFAPSHEVFVIPALLSFCVGFFSFSGFLKTHRWIRELEEE